MLLAFPIDDGRLEQDEMGDALKASLQENGMDFDTDQIGDLVAALWEDAGLASKEGTVFIWRMVLQLATKACQACY